VQRIAQSQGVLVINASYTFDEEILKKTARLRPTLKLEAMSPHKLLKSFTSLDLVEEAKLSGFIKRVENILADFDCACEIKHFKPTDTAAIYTKLEESNSSATIKQIKGAGNPFAGALKAFQQGSSKKANFCLNIDNELIQNTSTIGDEFLLKSIVEVLYVQALVLGKYTVNEQEMRIFNEALNNLIVMGMTNFVKL